VAAGALVGTAAVDGLGDVAGAPLVLQAARIRTSEATRAAIRADGAARVGERDGGNTGGEPPGGMAIGGVAPKRETPRFENGSEGGV
jgi:hypothetical protein